MDGHGGLPGGARLESSAETKGFYLLAVSPKQAFFDQYLKLPHNAMLYMPPWELDEMLALRVALFSEVAEELAKELFGIYGGVPRQVLQLAGSSDRGLLRDRLEIAIEAAAQTLPSVLSEGALAGSAVSDKVLLIRVLRLEPSKAYDFYKYDVVFRSSYVARLILQLGKAAASAATLLRISVMPKSAGAAAGALFEDVSLACLRRGGRFRVKLIEFPSSVVAPGISWKHFEFGTEISLSLPSLPKPEDVVPFAENKSELLRSLAVGQYGVPQNTNFPLVDYMLLLDGLTVLFNATVRETHPLDGNVLLTLLQNLPPSASRNVAFLFVVPETTTNFTSFAEFEVVQNNIDAVKDACERANVDAALKDSACVRFSLCLGALAIPMPVS